MFCFNNHKVFLIYMILMLISAIGKCSRASNSTNNYMFLNDEQLMKGRFIGLGKRSPKFLSFNTVDDDIVVEMQLSIPFLTIPVKKTMNAATGLINKIPTANINLASIGLAGAVIFGSVFILPSIVKLMHVDHIYQGRNSKSDDESLYTMKKLYKALDKHGTPPIQCVQRIVCTLVKKASLSKKQSSSDKIVDGLASNEWIKNLLDGTFLSDAMTTGYHSEESCSTKYSECKIDQHTLHNLAKFIGKT